jgi:hypothetical protein
LDTVGVSPPTGSAPSSSARGTTTTSDTHSESTQPATPSQPEERTLTSPGGSIRVRLAGGSLSMVGAPQPSPGFVANVDDESGDRVRVRFEGATGSYRITATIEGGHISSKVEDSGSSGTSDD